MGKKISKRLGIGAIIVCSILIFGLFASYFTTELSGLALLSSKAFLTSLAVSSTIGVINVLGVVLEIKKNDKFFPKEKFSKEVEKEFKQIMKNGRNFGNLHVYQSDFQRNVSVSRSNTYDNNKTAVSKSNDEKKYIRPNGRVARNMGTYEDEHVKRR